MIEFGHGTHAGLRRSRNEDTYYADAALGLFVVLDGMGGHRYGAMVWWSAWPVASPCSRRSNR